MKTSGQTIACDHCNWPECGFHVDNVDSLLSQTSWIGTTYYKLLNLTSKAVAAGALGDVLEIVNGSPLRLDHFDIIIQCLQKRRKRNYRKAKREEKDLDQIFFISKSWLKGVIKRLRLWKENGCHFCDQLLGHPGALHQTQSLPLKSRNCSKRKNKETKESESEKYTKTQKWGKMANLGPSSFSLKKYSTFHYLIFPFCRSRWPGEGRYCLDRCNISKLLASLPGTMAAMKALCRSFCQAQKKRRRVWCSVFMWNHHPLHEFRWPSAWTEETFMDASQFNSAWKKTQVKTSRMSRITNTIKHTNRALTDVLSTSVATVVCKLASRTTSSGVWPSCHHANSWNL